MNLKEILGTVVVRSAVIIMPVTFCYPLEGATPFVEQAIRIVPIQEGVNYDRPNSDEVPKCKIRRREVDGNGDGRIDYWK
jgi:hypothetical protein